MSVALATKTRDLEAALGSVPVARKSAKSLTSSGWLFIATTAEAVLPLLRNIVLARLLVPQQFGIAVSFAVVISMVEVMSDFGLLIYVVRKPDDCSRPLVMGTVQSMALVRSTLIGALLAAMSPLMATLFHAQGSGWAYALLGLIAFLRGFENFGVKEAMRHFVYWREAVVILSSQIVGVLVAIGVAMVHHDFTCLVWSMLATTLTMVIGSHLLSPRPYRLRWDAKAASDAAAFGRPLLLNGTAVSFALGDRMIVGSLIGAAPLAIYNVAYGTATLPRSVLAKFLTNAFLPLFVEDLRKGGSDGRLFASWAVFLSALAFAYGMAMCFVGDAALGIVFGAAYKPSRLFMCLASMSVCVKFLMLLPVPAAYASGETRIITTGSILSALSILPAAAVLALARNLDLFLLCIATAEAVALLLFVHHFSTRLSILGTSTYWAVATPYGLLTCLAVLAAWVPNLDVWMWGGACSLTTAISLFFYGDKIRPVTATLRHSRIS